jgi:hypothetical protein
MSSAIASTNLRCSLPKRLAPAGKRRPSRPVAALSPASGRNHHSALPRVSVKRPAGWPMLERPVGGSAILVGQQRLAGRFRHDVAGLHDRVGS